MARIYKNGRVKIRKDFEDCVCVCVWGGGGGGGGGVKWHAFLHSHCHLRRCSSVGPGW